MEIHEDRLTGFRAQIGHMIVIEHGSDVGFHHQIEFAGRSQIGGSAVRADLRIGHLIDTVAGLAVFAVAHNIAEAVDVAGGLPDLRMADDRGIQADDIIAFFHHFAPPELFDSPFHGGSVGTVIPEPVVPSVNFRTLEHKTAPFAERHDFIHQLAFRGDRHNTTPQE